MRAFGIASLSSTALYVGGKCRKPGAKKNSLIFRKKI